MLLGRIDCKRRWDWEVKSPKRITLILCRRSSTQATKTENIPVYPHIAKQIRYREGKCINAHDIIANPDTLRMAYEMIKSNPGNMTKGSDEETLDGISKSWFVETSKRLKKGQFIARPARRVYIPKPNGKKRPLGISSPRDKIIQQAMKLVLDCVVEPDMKDTSHGFRPNRSTHSALKKIRRWTGIAWFIEGDIKGFFDNIDHHKLHEILLEKFDDTKLSRLYWNFVKAGYIEWETKKRVRLDSIVGVPQGGIVSPVLSNMILHKLDVYMAEKIEKVKRDNENKKGYKVNPKYHAISNKIYRQKKKIISLPKPLDNEIVSEIRNAKKQRREIKSLIYNTELSKLEYVRYADDWIIGVWGGSRKKAEELKTKIEKYLRTLGLTLSTEKTLITNAIRGNAKFLGTMIKKTAAKEAHNKVLKDKRGVNRRITSGNIWMTAPIPTIIGRLRNKGIVSSRTGSLRSRYIPKFLPLESTEIINRFNSIIRGYLNYYSFVDNRTRLSKICWLLKDSLRKTLSRKLELNRREFNKNFGKNITATTKRRGKIIKVTVYNPNLNRSPMRFMNKELNWNPLKALEWKVSTKDRLESRCSVCEAEDNIEMHHIKHIKTLNLKLSEFDKAVASINRKQVPLCKRCHHKVHKGDYSGIDLKRIVWNK